jgi:hypothetical protein
VNRSRDARRDSGFRPIVTITLTIVIVVFSWSQAPADQHTWLDQFGSLNSEQAAAVDAGNNAVYVAGWIDYGALEGLTSNGSADAFVRCYDNNGLVVWTRQFGTSTRDRASAVAAIDGGCLVAGSTYGSLGANNAGVSDAFVQRRNADGDVVWTIQIGSSGEDAFAGLASNGTEVYVVGWSDAAVPLLVDTGGKTEISVPVVTGTNINAFMIKVDANTGAVSWVRRFGTAGYDKAYAVDIAGGGIYVAGRVDMALQGQTHYGAADVFVSRYDSDGNQVWARQFGSTSSDIAYAVAADESGIYVAGTTPTSLPDQVSFGSRDAFVLKYSHSGDRVWTRQIGGRGWDEGYGIATGPSGVYLAGRTDWGLDGQPSSVAREAFMVKMSIDGEELLVDQLGSPAHDENTAIAVSQMGAYVAGWTLGDMPGTTSLGRRDAFVARYDVPKAPEPEPQLMTLDIKPGECPKSINVQWMNNLGRGKSHNPKKGGVLPVALAAAADVDIGQIDPASCRLEGIEPLRWSYEDVSSPRSSADCSCEPSQPDGVLDLTLKFSKQAIIDALAARGATGESVLTMTAVLADGTPIEATSCVTLHNAGDLVQTSAYPNPFNPMTMIEYSIARDLPAVIVIYDVSGRLVARMDQPTRPAGVYHIPWDASSQASGVYFYRVHAGGSVASGRVTMIK